MVVSVIKDAVDDRLGQLEEVLAATLQFLGIYNIGGDN